MTIQSIKTPYNDFRSDTFTVPTPEMLQYGILNASYGDSVYKEDPSTIELEKYVSELTGKEAALFCVSGTLSNQIGIRANLLQPPYSILCDYRAHIFLSEAGGLATLSQAMVHPIIPLNGNYITLEDIIENYTPDDGDIHSAPTRLISLENTLHGIVTPLEEIRKIGKFAQENNMLLHCDGARIWNASIATGESIKDICEPFDLVSLCLSKSLGAPMGSMIVGNQKFIDKCNHFKKQAGGGIRQAGLMTTMAHFAIEENFSKLIISHNFAAEVAKLCTDNGIALESPADSSFVFLDLKENKWNDQYLIELGRKYGIKLMGGRLAFHFQLTRESVENLKKVLIDCQGYHLVNPYTGRRTKKMYNVDALSHK